MTGAQGDHRWRSPPPRYAAELAEFARRRCLAVVALTDHALPLVERRAEHCLPVPFNRLEQVAHMRSTFHGAAERKDFRPLLAARWPDGRGPATRARRR